MQPHVWPNKRTLSFLGSYCFQHHCSQNAVCAQRQGSKFAWTEQTHRQIILFHHYRPIHIDPPLESGMSKIQFSRAGPEQDLVSMGKHRKSNFKRKWLDFLRMHARLHHAHGWSVGVHMTCNKSGQCWGSLSFFESPTSWTHGGKMSRATVLLGHLWIMPRARW